VGDFTMVYHVLPQILSWFMLVYLVWNQITSESMLSSFFLEHKKQSSEWCFRSKERAFQVQYLRYNLTSDHDPDWVQRQLNILAPKLRSQFALKVRSDAELLDERNTIWKGQTNPSSYSKTYCSKA
jgi:hypothetical protein